MRLGSIHKSDLLFPTNLALLREAPSLDHSAAPSGLLEQREGAALYVLARRGIAVGGVVEIGAYRGRSTRAALDRRGPQLFRSSPGLRRLVPEAGRRRVACDHDTVDLWYGPTRLVRELLATSSELTSIGVIESMLYARKQRRRRGIGSAHSARAAFELVTEVRVRRFGRGPLNHVAGEL